MKNNLFFVFIFSAIMFFEFFQIEPIFADSLNWCRITEENTYLYKSANLEQENNVLFKLPVSYFAIILDDADSFYKVSYKQEVGYVKKENVTCVYSTPTTPFPVDITFKANDITSISILDTPSVNGNYLGSILCGSYAEFYGEVAGDEAIKNLGNTWFYMSYTQNDKQILGYVYAPLTTNLTPIKENLEQVSLTPVSTTPKQIILSPELLDSNNIFIIGALCLVGIILILAIFVPLKKLKYKQNHRVIKVPTNDKDFDF